MANIFAFEGRRPVVHESAFLYPTATVVGDVVIGAGVYVGPGAVLRGDWGKVVIEAGSNVQENCVIHSRPDQRAYLKEAAHIGHGAIVHGATIGRDVLVGMNAVVADDAVIGDESIVGALTYVPAGMQVPARKVVVGSPATIVKDVDDEMLAWKVAGTTMYQGLPARLQQGLARCEPLRPGPESG